MSNTPQFDAKLDAILSTLAPGQERVCSMTGDTWVLDEGEIAICKKFRVPPSKVKPGTRMNMLNGYNTGLAIFWNKDAFTGKPIISAIHPDLPFKVMDDIEWYKQDFASKGHDVDDRSVFDQIWDLMTAVPMRAKRNRDVDATSIAVGSTKTVESYMSCAGSTTRSYYTFAIFGAEDCLDVVNGTHITRSFAVNDSQQIADCEYVFSSYRCLQSSFLFDCRDCELCFGATNKRHKKFLWFNEQLSEEEWRKRRREVDLGCRSAADAWLQKFYTLWWTDGVWPAYFGIRNEESEGEHLSHCVQCTGHCFWLEKCTGCVRSRFGLEANDCAYCSGFAWETRSYMSTGGIGGADNRLTMGSTNGVGLEYCAVCDDCQHCFGCVGLHKKQYHIFNKPYAPEEYWKRVDELKCRMLEEETYGEFFPGRFSLSGFEHSTGAAYYDYRERDLKRFGAIRVDAARGLVLAPKREEAHVVRLRVDELPDCVDAVKDGIVNSPIHDKELDRDFSIVPKELEMYQAKRWPLPRRHFIARLTHWLRHSNAPFPTDVMCGACGAKTTTYKSFLFPERVVYCMPCYTKFLEKNG